MTDIVMKVALKEGQKAAAAFASKVVTVSAAALASNKVIKEVSKNDSPLSEVKEEDVDFVEKQRIIRDAGISAACSMIALTVHTLICVGIEGSN